MTNNTNSKALATAELRGFLHGMTVGITLATLVVMLTTLIIDHLQTDEDEDEE